MTGERLRSTIQWAGLVSAPVLAGLAYLVLPVDGGQAAAGVADGLSYSARITAAIGVWMAIWWITEAIPVYATALIPVALLPVAGATTLKQAAGPYAHELIFLFMGGFILALSVQRWGLHRRVALAALRMVGSRPANVVGGFMLATGFISMWVTNTATSIMMLPIALSVIDVVGGDRSGSSDENKPGRSVDPLAERFPVCLLLGVAYAATIGGVGTLIGTAPNLFLASYVKDELGVEISFIRWMGIGIPVVVIFLPITWLLLTKMLYPLGRGAIEAKKDLSRRAYRDLGPMSRGERATLTVFVITALLWVVRPVLMTLSWAGMAPFAGLSDPGIAILGALALFVIPVDARRRVFVMDWRTVTALPWGILVLFGGGLSLAAAIGANGVGEWIGRRVGALAGLPPLVLVTLVVTLVIFLTELTSNTASTATLVPILAALAPGLGISPFLMIVPATIAASCAFMLPVATPPNAVVFSSGRIRIGQMSRAGLWLNFVGIILITALAYTVMIPLLADIAEG
ncbi:MAG: SLC13 family permease [Acidobacteriota bacterium]